MKKYFIALLLFSLFSSFVQKSKWDDDKSEWTPLMNAIYKWDTEKFSKLIKKKKQLTFVTSGKNGTLKLTALDVALRRNNDIAAALLLKTGKFTNYNEYLQIACSGNNVKTLKLLFEYGADPDFILENGNNPLYTAASEGSPEILTEMLQHSKNVNHQIRGQTILMLTARDLNVEKVKILLANGADKNLKDNKGKTAFDYVKYIRRKESDKALIVELEDLLKL